LLNDKQDVAEQPASFSGSLFRVERDADRTKEAILAAAEVAFARHGCDGVTLAQIGGAAGVSRATPGYFFGTKADLYEIVLARVIARAEAAMLDAHTRIDSPDSPDGAVATYVGAFLNFLAQDQAYLRLLQREALGDASRVATLFGRPVQDTLDALAPAAEAAGVSAQRLLLDIIALCWYPFAHEHTLLPALEMKPRDPAFVEEHKRHVVALISGLTPKRGRKGSTK
jgi:AcrR family transcriptional regulator